MIALTAQDGTPVCVNSKMIWHVRAASGDQTAIYAASGAVLFVQETYGRVCDLLEPGAAAPGDLARDDD